MTKEEQQRIHEEIKLHRIAISKLRNDTLISIILRRIVTLIPFYLMIVSVGIYSILESMFLFLIYGGEAIIYKRRTRKLIVDVFEELDKLNKQSKL